MPRVVLHPGFHKTGTSTLQRGAKARKRLLDKHLRLLLTDDVLEATRFSRSYSAQGNPATLKQFKHAFHAALSKVDTNDQRPLVISAEDLCGHMPGSHGVVSYSAAPTLLLSACEALHSVFGNTADITLLLTTRQEKDWLRSAYWQILRSTRLTDEFDVFADQFAQAAQFDATMGSVSEATSGLATTHILPIESCGDSPRGPLGALLDLLDIKIALPVMTAHNIQPDGAAEAFLALNRSNMDKAELQSAKRDLLKQYRTSGQTKRRL